jgi:hypothetical protein
MSRQLSRRLYLGQKERPQRGDMSKKGSLQLFAASSFGQESWRSALR